MPTNLIIAVNGVRVCHSKQKITSTLPSSETTYYDSSKFDTMLDANRAEIATLKQEGKTDSQGYKDLLDDRAKIIKRRKKHFEMHEEWSNVNWDEYASISGRGF